MSIQRKREPTRIRRPGSPILFAITMISVLAIGWTEDNRSCVRQDPPRIAVNSQNSALKVDLQTRIMTLRTRIRLDLDTGPVRTLDQQSIYKLRIAESQLRTIQPLTCDKIFPDT